MWKKLALTGAVAAAVVGVGTAAMAVSGETSGTPVSSLASVAAAADRGDHPGIAKLGRRALHGQVVTRGTDSTFVTHDFIRGEVTAVSPTSISVKAADNVTEQFVVNADTKVRVRHNGQGSQGSISDIHVGDKVLVAGTGTGPFTAKHIVKAG